MNVEIKIGAKAQIKSSDGKWRDAVFNGMRKDGSLFYFVGQGLAKNTNGRWEINNCVRTPQTRDKSWRIIE